MFSFLRQPKWIAFTLLVPVGIALCLLAANWQYSRHVNRSAADALIRANSGMAATRLADLAAPDQPLAADRRYRIATATGSYLPNSAALVRRRSLGGSAGYWAIASLKTDAGPVVEVLRGWVPQSADARLSPAVPPPPTGEVTVTGWLQEPERTAQPAPADLPAGQVSALDPSTLNPGAAVYPAYLVAMSSQPPDAGLTTVPVPELGLGPHLAYAWQWLAFAVMLPIGWGILARREVQAARADKGVSDVASSAR
ncbi:MAG: SURF1 family protein [Candidatus Nanopelagicales bacterium]